MNVSPGPDVSPTVRASLERLHALLAEEGGLMAGLVVPPGDRDVAPGAAQLPGAAPDSAQLPGAAPDSAQLPGAAGDGPPPGSDSQVAGRDGHRPTEVTVAPTRGDAPAQLTAAGPRAEGSRGDYELVIETIYEGYLLHYGKPRVALTSEADLGLLAGDRLYALGLARLIALGDIAAVVELADTITLSALAQGAGTPELADAVWAAGARAIGWGSSEAHSRAKKLALAGSPEAIEAMRTSAAGLAAPR